VSSAIDDIFVRLINHRVTDDHARWEDYLTECFVHLLEHDEALQDRLLGPGGVFFGARHAERGPQPGELLRFGTQRGIGRHGRPDVHIEGDRGFLLLVECKAGAGYDAGQIRSYCNYAVEQKRGSVVSLIPRRSRPGDTGVESPAFLGIVEWEQVGEVLRALPEAEDERDLLRRALHRLLDRYGFVPIEGKLPWEEQEGEDGVAAVKRLCGVLHQEAMQVAGDAGLMARSPGFYRQDDGRWMLVPGPPTIQGKGAPPRKVLSFPVTLHGAVGAMGSLSMDVGFMPYFEVRSPMVTLTHHMQRGIEGGAKSPSDFLRKYLRAGGLVEGALGAVDDEHVTVAHDRAVRRAATMMQRVADRLAAGGSFGDHDPHVLTTGHQIRLALAPTQALLGSDEADPTVFAPRFRRWLKTSLDAFFDSDPTEPVAKFVAEAVMPSVGRY